MTYTKLSALACGVALLLSACVTPLPLGKPAPQFSVRTLDKKTVSLSDLHGRVVVLNYWATWCGPCKQELPVLDTYARTHATAPVTILALEPEYKVQDYQLRKLAAKVGFTVVRDLRGTGYDLIDGAFPTSYIIDRDGVLRYAAVGAFTKEGLAAQVDPLLATNVSADAPAPTPTGH